MKNTEKSVVVNGRFKDTDTNAENRKSDHIELAFKSKVSSGELDSRFYYEPVLSAHPDEHTQEQAFGFLGKKMRVPIWVSSMTGGTKLARTINQNLARACKEFGMGMGLGSCRSLLSGDEFLPDFDVRDFMGEDAPLYANLGIAQVEELLAQQKADKMPELVRRLRADGLIIHINPFQEWLQPEGDRFQKPPLETLTEVIESFPGLRLIVKEVGQGMGYHSLKALFQLPLEAIDFAAAGGTNFARLELFRGKPELQELFGSISKIGHTAEEMTFMSNEILDELGDRARCKQVIISGGISDFTDGYYLTESINNQAVYGQASAFLKHARDDYETLQRYVKQQVRGFRLAKAFLRVRKKQQANGLIS